MAAGRVIGACNDTGASDGSHLHYDLKINTNPVNPLEQYDDCPEE